jgi:hypothetical protein
VPSFKVAEIVGKRPWPNEEDTKVIYFNFRAEGVERVCNIGRKPGNELKVGDVLEATSEDDGRGGLKLKVQNNFAGGGGPRPEDPKRSARILRQHSQQMAIEWVALALSRGKLPEDFTLAKLWALVDAFDKDACEAGDKA